MQIATLSGYRTKFRTAKQRARDRKMKSCARGHRVTSRGFWACVRKGKRGSR